MATATHDYDKLEREYIASDISIRGLCRKHGIKGYSSVAQYAREHDWNARRAKVHGRKAEKVTERVAERLADSEADEILSFQDEILTVSRAALYKLAQQLNDPGYRLRVDELVKLLNVALLVRGQPTERIEERRLDVIANFDNIPADILRAIVDSTRPALPDVGGSARRTESESPRGGAESTRPN